MGRWIVKCSTIVNYEITVNGNNEEEAISNAKAGDYRPQDVWELGQEDEWVYNYALKLDEEIEEESE